jgi:dihydrodipicolinate synthase/N-acetylneuraminate lyase
MRLIEKAWNCKAGVKMIKLEGIHFMMPTPFDEKGKIDEESISPLIDLAVKAGCEGVVCLGSNWRSKSPEW